MNSADNRVLQSILPRAVNKTEWLLNKVISKLGAYYRYLHRVNYSKKGHKKTRLHGGCTM